MTALQDLIGIRSFGAALRGVVAVASTHGEQLLAATAKSDDHSPPDGLPELRGTSWDLVVRAFQVVYEISDREGRDAVLAEVRDAFPELTAEPLAALSLILERDDVASSRIEGARKRDRFLPVLASTDIALDLRLAEVSGEEVLLPVITCRLEFDENVAGNDAIVFQIPIDALATLSSELLRIQGQLGDVRSRLAPERIPDWALQ
jgi:hypothetical protein